MGVAGPGRLIDRLQPHQVHQTANPVTADANAFAPQMADYLAAAVERKFEKDFINPPHQRKVLRALALRSVVE